MNIIRKYSQKMKPIYRKPLSTGATGIRQSLSSPSSNPQIDHILYLQRTLGNREVQRLLKSHTLKAKLTIRKPNDKYEQEADHVVGRIMIMPDPKQSPVQRESTCLECREEGALQAKPLARQIAPLVQPHADSEEEEGPVQTKPIQRRAGPGEEEEFQRQPEEEEEETIQRKGVSLQTRTITPSVESDIQSLKGGGQSLLQSTRDFFEPRFGTDFSQVRVHTDSKAAETAKAVNARAFTIGKNVVFGKGQYSTGTSEGKRLMAHELTHVVQQKGKSKNTIHRWKKEYHILMTKDIGQRFKINRGFLSSVSKYNAGVDSRSSNPLDHGECLGYWRRNTYKCTNTGRAAALNQAQQNIHLNKALNYRKEYNALIKGTRAQRRLSKRAEKLERENLGFALHVAQDRGAHGEGVQGYGHSSRMRDKCDYPRNNKSGWQAAGRNTIQVFNQYLRGIGSTKRYTRQIPTVRISVPFSFGIPRRRWWSKPQRFYVSALGKVKVTVLSASYPRIRRPRRFHVYLYQVLHGYNYFKGKALFHTGKSNRYHEWRRLPTGFYSIKVRKSSRRGQLNVNVKVDL